MKYRMNVTKISIYQLITLLTLFLLGSSIVLGLNLEAEENAWLINSGAAITGVLLFFFYAYLLKRNGWPEFHKLLEQAFGKFLGKAILILYSLYFLYIGTRVLKDFVYFITQTFYYNIDHWIIAFVSVCLICYAATLGLEAVARTSELLFIFTFLLIALIVFFSFLSGVMIGENIRPIIDLEILDLSKWIQYITFPYGEMVVFLVLFPFLNDHQKLMKQGWMAVLFSGVILISITEIIIAILGAKVASLYTYPLVKAIEMIEFLGIIQHLELLTAFAFIIVGFVKVSIFFIAGSKGVSYIFPILQEKFIIIILGALMFIGNYVISRDLPEHLFIGLELVPLYLHVPFQFILPLLILIITWIKGIKNKSNGVGY
ncbi:GerAB/ArcD/ProY family transporter [Sutcliffiella horikoshii]|uniref:GerAB/ArcD/ProY family transporter n=2 Tax=Sutcliffiella horikoshii TaxID=79883 RepID=A0AA95B4R7_9BACI|nr:GerAB/ArcD/ProY family transporter [Sutcliffiella horikoshii]